MLSASSSMNCNMFSIDFMFVYEALFRQPETMGGKTFCKIPQQIRPFLLLNPEKCSMGSKQFGSQRVSLDVVETMCRNIDLKTNMAASLIYNVTC
jgi:hypothetical protein